MLFLNYVCRRFITFPLFPTLFFFFFFFNDPATPEIYPLPLHAALPILGGPARRRGGAGRKSRAGRARGGAAAHAPGPFRSEEHTSELQSLTNLVCRLLLEKKKAHV